MVRVERGREDVRGRGRGEEEQLAGVREEVVARVLRIYSRLECMAHEGYRRLRERKRVACSNLRQNPIIRPDHKEQLPYL